jgi:hypothetical protein
MIARLEDASIGYDRDLVVVALVAYALCLQDPDLSRNATRFQDALDSVSNHICWVLQGASVGNPNLDPKLMN